MVCFMDVHWFLWTFTDVLRIFTDFLVHILIGCYRLQEKLWVQTLGVQRKIVASIPRFPVVHCFDNHALD